MNVALNNILSVRIKVSDNESAAELWYIIMVLFDYEMVQCFVNCNDKRVFKPVATEALPLGHTSKILTLSILKILLKVPVKWLSHSFVKHEGAITTDMNMNKIPHCIAKHLC